MKNLDGFEVTFLLLMLWLVTGSLTNQGII